MNPECIRLAVPGEAAAIAELVNQAFRPQDHAASWTHESALVSGDRASTAQVAALISRKDSVLLLALNGTRMLACIHLEKHGQCSNLGMLAVHPSLQRSGLGKRLLHAAEQYCVQVLGAQQLSLQVLTVRTELLSFYLRRGYRSTGQLDGYPVSEGIGLPLQEGLVLQTLAKPAAEVLRFDAQ